MKIEYNLTKYFKDNNLFKTNESENITIKKENETIIIKGKEKDLIELADIIISIVKDEKENSHIHIDKDTLINKESEISEIIIEKY